MAQVATPDASTIAMQQLLDAGLNGFAVELLVESYASPKRVEHLGGLAPLTFVWRGVALTIRPAEVSADGDGIRLLADDVELVREQRRRLEAARRAYLLTIATRHAWNPEVGPCVRREYLREKVQLIYQLSSPEQIRAHLDPPSTAAFDRFLAEGLSA